MNRLIINIIIWKLITICVEGSIMNNDEKDNDSDDNNWIVNG